MTKMMRAAASRSLVAVLLVLVGLAGCAQIPESASGAPEPAVKFTETAPERAPVWAEQGWWKGFGSPQLNQLIAQAETGSFDIQAAIARIQQADAQLVISGASLLPSLNGSADSKWQRSYSNGSVFTGRSRYVDSRSSAIAASASYDLDIWGKIAAGRDAALASAIYARAERDTVALDTIAAIATTWFTASAYQDRIAVSRRNLADAEEILRAIRARREAGTASDLDVSQQEALVAGVRAGIPALQSNVSSNLYAMSVLVGSTPEKLHLQAATLLGLSMPDVAPGLPSELLHRRPDIAAAEAQLEAARANVRVARAALYPDVSLTGSGGLSNASVARLFGPTSLLASLAANVTQTIFDNGALQGQVTLNEGKRDELVADYRKSIVQAFADVETALAQYRNATEQERLEAQAVEVAQRAANISRQQMLAGTNDIVTALQTQQTLFNDIDNLAQVRLSRVNALVALYKALGGGWNVQLIIPPETHLFQGVL